MISTWIFSNLTSTTGLKTFYLDTVFSFGLISTITDRPSRSANHSSTLSNNIFTNAEEYNNVSWLLVNNIDSLSITYQRQIGRMKSIHLKIWLKNAFASYRIVSCRVVSCRVVSCRVVSCRVVSCRVASRRVASRRVA